ncbi:mandelate racemase/muconate lactonizing enzyme family protein [Oceanobacillus arenosus]|uniref:mandelate racemase/muconate lactonizing enzyme family protein n=1 Tax=Oceanobacillus arenosus TaxID=1229153 RepID=UPI001472F076|nr:mandelate racemase/muconate lactonizing enzyme family protein [Oceanobacillus arenosus]
MKLENYSIHHVSVPFKRPLTTGIHEFLGIENVLVEIEAEGIKGIGYAFCFNPNQAKATKAMVVDLLESIKGKDISNVQKIWNDMWWRINFIGQTGPPVMAMSAIDTALWDIIGKKANMPLYKLWGGFRDEVPVYATGGWISYSMGELIEEATTYKEQGHTHYKIKVGQQDWQKDVVRVKQLRENVGQDFEIMVDANQAWTVNQSILFANAIEEYNIYWFEEPNNIHDIRGTAEIRKNINIPLATGETVYTREGFKPLITNNVADVLMPDLMRCGGPTEFLKIAQLADTYHLPVSSHTFTEMSLHLMAAVPNGTIAEYIPNWWDDLFEGGPKVKDGKLKLNNNPGHGYRFAEEVIKGFNVVN